MALCPYDLRHWFDVKDKHIHTHTGSHISKPRHEISNNVVCATSKASDQPLHTRSLNRAFANRLDILCLLSY